MVPVTNRIALTVDSLPAAMIPDAGYWRESNTDLCVAQGINGFIATGCLPYGQSLPSKRVSMPGEAGSKSTITRKLIRKAGSRVHVQFMAIVEPANASLKADRYLCCFLLRGLEKVVVERHLIGATHNLRKLFKYKRSHQQVMANGRWALADMVNMAESLGTA